MKRIILLLAAVLLAGGCEDDDNSFFLRASRETVCEGEQCELVAHYSEDDGLSREDFTWSLSDPSIGHLSHVHGRHADYVPTKFPAPGEPEPVQTVKCKLLGDPFEGDFFNLHAHVRIRHLAGRRR